MKNSKILVVIIMSLLCYTSLNAQVNPGLNFGIKGGMNYSGLNLSFTELDKNKTGYHIGGFVSIPLGNRFSVRPELLYSTKGAKVNYNWEFINGNLALDLRYLDLPVMGVIHLTKNISLEGGPYASLLLDSKAKVSSNIPFLNLSRDVPKEFFSKVDYGFAAGAGLRLGNLGGGVRYNYGIGKVEKVKQLLGTDFTLTNARNTVWQLYLTYTF